MKLSKIIRDQKIYDKLFPHDVHRYATINPTNNKILKVFEYDSRETVEDKIKASHKAFLNWKDKSLDYRFEKFKTLAKNFENNKEDLAKLITLEMGKPINESRGEITKSVNHIKYYLNNTRKFLTPHFLNFDNYENHIDLQPLGVCLSIVPWNFPLWVGMKSIIPCMFAGNTVIFKPSTVMPQTSIMIEEIFRNSGLGDEFIMSFADHQMIEDPIISDRKIKCVVFTGSTRVGSIIGAATGKHLKKSLLELGGADPFIVFEDADLKKAVTFAAEGRLRNTGQACICAKRIILHESVYDKFIDMLQDEIKKFKVGDPMDPSSKLGPISRFDFFLKIKHQVLESVIDHGVELVGTTIEEIDEDDYRLEKGNYLKPIIMTNIKRNTPAYREEIFGPVFSIYKFKTFEEAVKIANDTEYGLGASIFTEDESKALECSRRIDSGMVFINQSSFSDSRLPYGGVKKSGIGRTSAWAAFYEFTNNKLVSINKS
jgi:succinate-semialdehyde dehydrogenase/glutarate-semialdehyde dehydrogenase